jgi:hypothetical protein
VTVAYVGNDCFTLTIVLRGNYTETMSLCIKGIEVVEEGGTRSQQFAIGAAAQTTTECKPGDVYFTTAPSPGQMWTHDCTGKNSDDKSGASTFKTAGTYRFVGNEAVAVKGIDLPVMHFHDDRTVSGAQSGTNIADWYFAVEDGLLVQLSRNINLNYPSGVGNIAYHESALMTLTGRPAGDASTD